MPRCTPSLPTPAVGQLQDPPSNATIAVGSYQPNGGEKWERVTQILARQQELQRKATQAAQAAAAQPARNRPDPPKPVRTIYEQRLPQRRTKKPSKRELASSRLMKERERKERRAAAAEGKRLALQALVEERLSTQRLLERVRRTTFQYGDRPRAWWGSFTEPDRLRVREEFLRRRIPADDPPDEAAALAAEFERERRISAALWFRPKPVWSRTHTIVVDRLVPGNGLKTMPFDQVRPDYWDQRDARFWHWADRSGGPDSCWPWHGEQRFDTGYGQASWHGSLCPAHRIAWTLHHGLELPYDVVVDHLCLCRWCVNPDHLEPVTRGENNRRQHHRSPETTRTRTSFEAPFEERWYPFGRRNYDENGKRKP